MNTLSVKLRYRPLRLGWCVSAGDFEGFRRAVRLNFTMWGGRFNPIIPVGDKELADALVKLFRVDVLIPASLQDDAKEFSEKFKYLPWPFMGKELFVDNIGGGKGPRIADISHPIARLYNDCFKNNPNPESVLDLYEWEVGDALADIFLCSYGAVPSFEDIGVDYYGLASTSLFGARNIITNGAEIQIPQPGRETIASLNAAFIETHYAVQNHSNYPGFYVGEVDNFSDLVNFWNLRATRIPLQFFDPRYVDRQRGIATVWADHLRKAPPRRFGPQGLAIWHRPERSIDQDLQHFGAGITDCAVRPEIWNGGNVRAPIVYFSESSALASVGENGGVTTASFTLSGKPFVGDQGAHEQHYVLSVDPGIGLFRNERSTLQTPFIPELNEFYGRNAHFIWSEARAEPESLGIISSVSTDNQSLRALDVSQLIVQIFETVGIEASPSRPGLVATTLIRQMGGLDGCRPFKIAGVRSLIENHRPDQSFDRGCAMQTILGKDTAHPLSDYQWLYIEPRKIGSELKNDAVLAYLLDKGVFRPGLNFHCPSCRLEFWRTLDDAASRLECEYCGHGFNTSPQLRDKGWAFRRSGLFGRDDHQGGAIPVLLTLQQLTNMNGLSDHLFTSAMELKPKGAAIPACETDFVVVTSQVRDHRIQIAIGECKTRKPITADDVAKLTAVANAFPSNMYDVFIVFARLTPFTPEEIELVKAANGPYQCRVILLTDRELEPYFIYERTAMEFDIRETAVSYEDLAHATVRVFFQNARRPTAEGEFQE